MKKLLATMVLGIFVFSITTGSTGFAAEDEKGAAGATTSGAAGAALPDARQYRLRGHQLSGSAGPGPGQSCRVEQPGCAPA